MRIHPAKIVRVLRQKKGSVRETARVLGISPGTVINWRKKAEGYEGHRLKYLARASTRPKNVPGEQISEVMGTALQELRRATRFGADKLKFLLKLPVHRSTVHRWLKKNNLVLEGTNHRRPRRQPTRHMYVKNALTPGKLQMDVKYVTPELSGLPKTAYLYAVMDIFSRYKQGVILERLDQETAIAALKHLTPLFPLAPDFIQTDNGREFQAEFDAFVRGLGWDHHYIHKSSPNENGVIERSFRTDEDEFFGFRMVRPKNLRDLNLQYQIYLDEYNTERPHLSLNMMTPVEKLKSVQDV